MAWHSKILGARVVWLGQGFDGASLNLKGIYYMEKVDRRNTIGPTQSTSPHAKRHGDSGDSGDNLDQNAGDKVTVIGQFVDEEGQKWVILNQGQNTATCPYTLFTAHNRWHQLADQFGITLLSNAAKNLLMKRLQTGTFTAAKCIRKVGWNGHHFALGNGEIIAPKKLADQKVICAIEKNSKFDAKGSLQEYWKPLKPLIKNQELLMFSFGCAFLAPLLEPLFRTPWSTLNPIFDWCGKSGKGKTICAILLPGSALGTGSTSAGYGETWYLTKGGILPQLRDHADHLLGLDEANMAGDGEKGPEYVIPDSVFIISDGRVKVRFDSDPKKTSAYRNVVVSTSNDALQSLGSKRKAEAVAARCITIHIPDDNKYGVLSHLPAGYDDSAKVIDRIKELARTHYGAPIRTYLARLVEDRHCNEADLIKRIIGYAEKFMEALGDITSAQKRRAKLFALSYAAARLARYYGALPSKEEIGHLMQAYLKVWDMTGTVSGAPASKVRDPVAVLREYVRKNRREFVKLEKPNKMSNHTFDKCPGFLWKGKSTRSELILSPAAFGNFAFSTAEKGVLRRQRYMVCETGRKDNKRRVRIVGASPAAERVFVLNYSKLST
jgi:Domain of unknown function (DUF927)